MEKVSVFLPTRKGSERVKNKNTRTFAGIKGGLLSIKIQQLLKLEQVEEIILSTNDPMSMEVAECFDDNRLKVIERPENLALSKTDLTELIDYVPKICQQEHILWTHVTSPFTNQIDYSNAIAKYFEVLDFNNHDSIISGTRFQNFLWSPDSNKVINKTGKLKWPRTQDLMPLFEIDSAIFIASKKIYHIERDRIGKRPYLFAQERLKSFDIDWEDDFEIAELLFNYGKY
jgi:N-acylneuraminate cytidylyltransferase